MSRVLVTRPLPPGSLDPLAGHEIVTGSGDLLADAAGVDGIVCQLTDRIDSAVVAAGAGRLRVVAVVAVGYDNVDVDACRSAGVTVCNTPGVLDETVADLAFALILAASRLMSTAEADLRAGRWPGWALDQYLGVDVHGAHLGLVGYGRTGRAVARRACGFGMTVSHHTRRPTGEPGWQESLDRLLAEADVISVHVPLTADTRHLLDRRRIGLLRRAAVFVNTSRGPVVDEEALADALEDGRLFAAGLDVYENEPTVHPRLLAAPRTVLLPHIGSASVATRTAMARLAAHGAAEVLAGRMPTNVVA